MCFSHVFQRYHTVWSIRNIAFLPLFIQGLNFKLDWERSSPCQPLRKIKEHQQESRNENVAKEISVIEDDFIKLKQAVSKRLISLK